MAKGEQAQRRFDPNKARRLQRSPIDFLIRNGSRNTPSGAGNFGISVEENDTVVRMERDALNACKATVSSVGFARRRGYRKLNALHMLSLPRFNRKVRTHYERRMLESLSVAVVRDFAKQVPLSGGKIIEFAKYVPLPEHVILHATEDPNMFRVEEVNEK